VNRFLVWWAQAFGLGRFPVAPGTLGSVLGLGWFGLLLITGHWWLFLGGTLAGLALCVWLCGTAEKVLGQKDPGTVVVDEITAMPVCFIGWMGIEAWKTGAFPAPDYFLQNANWPLVLGVFAAFRFFDIAKPWPVRQSQALSGGWGVTVDDVLAAVYVNLTVLAVYTGKIILTQP
jgi:phosphatidylglycerophosphatase A